MRVRRRWLVAALGAAAWVLVVAAGCRREPVAAPTSAPAGVPLASVDGAAVYAEHCARCHMADGWGVPNFQPPIRGRVAAGDDGGRLERVIRAGSAALTDRPNPDGWQMPPFGFLTDAEMAALMTHVRTTFGAAADTGGAAP